MASSTSAQNFFVSIRQSKKFELIQKSRVPRALRFSCQGLPAKRSEKGYGDVNEPVDASNVGTQSLQTSYLLA